MPLLSLVTLTFNL